MGLGKNYGSAIMNQLGQALMCIQSKINKQSFLYFFKFLSYCLAGQQPSKPSQSDEAETSESVIKEVRSETATGQ